MNPSESTHQATREEWRELGFFYDHDDAKKEWRLVGSRSGLSRFASALRTYCEVPRNTTLSEHEHYGPYMYLKIMTWSEAGIDDRSIHGSLDDLQRLAALTETALMQLPPGDTIHLGDHYVSDPEHDLLLVLKPDGFDPATADPLLG